MSSFTFIQRIRNKIKIKGINNTIDIKDKNRLKIVNSTIDIKGSNNTLIIKEDVIIRDSTIELHGENCTIIISAHCMVGHNCYLSAKENATKLELGEYCGLSRNIKIMTSDGHPIFQNNKQINLSKYISINNHVWLADNVTILKGVEIGTNSVVGINSTLTKSIASEMVAVGNPAKIIKNNIKWEK